MARNTKDPMQFVQGTSTQIAAQTLKAGEPVFDTTAKTLVVGDGATKGGVALATKAEVTAAKSKADTSVQLSGNQSITGNKTFTGEVKYPTPVTIAANATPAQVLALLGSADGLKGVNVQTLLALIAGYLPLSGGTVSNNINQKLPNVDVAANDNTSQTLCYGFDKNNKQLFQQYYVVNKETNIKSFILSMITELAGVDNYRAFTWNIDINTGAAYATTATPSTTAPNNAIYNKEALNRDFLSKAGGELTGNLTMKKSEPWINLYNLLNSTVAPSADSIAFRIRSSDVNNKTMMELSSTQLQSKEISTMLRSCCYANANAITSDIVLHAEAGGTTYATCPPPRGTYTNDIATFKSLVDYAPKKLTAVKTYYINANTGSDTADLNNGRGESANKPFKTLNSAVTWVQNNVVCQSVELMLDSDITLTQDLICAPCNITALYIKGKTSSIKLNTANYKIKNNVGFLRFDYLTITSTSDAIFQSNGLWGWAPRILLYENITFNGTCSIALDCYGGDIVIAAMPSGSLTGKRYSTSNGGRLILNGKDPNSLPGTIAGTVDSGGVVC